MSEAAPQPGSRFEEHTRARTAHWDAVARATESTGGGYHRRLREIYRHAVAPGQRVLEVGCGLGDLLASLEPAHGVGIDFSAEMIARARERHPALTFVNADAHALAFDAPFDVVILSDLVNDVWDVQTILERVALVATPTTRVIINTYSRVWQPLLAVAGALGLARPVLNQNWLTAHDVKGLLDLAGFEVIRSSSEILWPVRTPLVDGFFNRIAVHTWPLKHLALTNVVLARPKPRPKLAADAPLVSVVVPARNEAGNIAAVFARTPPMGGGVELVFVEGHSRDDTYETIVREVAAHPGWNCQVLRQSGVGKGDAVRFGFSKAKGDVLMILDADLTMPPEELPRYYAALWSGQADFVNGVRLVYPMDGKAMQPLNVIANHFFSWAFTWLLGQRVKDTLCGTKALWKKDYERIVANRSQFGDFDPFGDYDLLFGAAKLNLKISDMPIRYQERSYGTTNIQRWRHGLLLFRMLWFALWRLKFV
jgi:SAM-dependent methyltransferase